MFQGNCNDIIQGPSLIPRAPHNIGQYRGPVRYQVPVWPTYVSGAHSYPQGPSSQ